MINACYVLEQISNTSSRNAKIKLLEENKTPELQFLLETALNPYLTYGVNIFNNDVVYGHTVPSLATLTELRNQLVSRKITGSYARVILADTLLVSNSVVRKWLTAVFQKDLRIGASRETVNKVFPNLIPKFELQLCDKVDEDFELTGEWFAEPKFDGLRCVIILRDSTCTVLSRNGKELYNVDHIINELQVYASNCVLDGELLGLNWNETASVAKASKNQQVNTNLIFNVFDILSLNEWDSKQCNRTLLTRKETLQYLIPKLQYTKIVPYIPINDMEQGWKQAQLYREQGLEGAVIKRLDSLYSFDRNKDWLKLKFTDTIDLEVVNIEQGTGKNANRLGALICQLPNGNKVNVGGGYNDEQRDQIWKERKEVIGRVIEIKYQDKTKDGSIRFPVFVRFRDDK